MTTGIKKLSYSGKFTRKRIVRLERIHPLHEDFPLVGTDLKPTKQVTLSIYNDWRYIPQGRFARELFSTLYVVPTPGVAPSKRKRNLYHMFQRSLEIMWYHAGLQTQDAQALAQAS